MAEGNDDGDEDKGKGPAATATGGEVEDITCEGNALYRLQVTRAHIDAMWPLFPTLILSFPGGFVSIYFGLTPSRSPLIQSCLNHSCAPNAALLKV